MSHEATQQKAERGDILRMTAEVVAAYVGNNSLPATQLPDVINTVYGTLHRVNGVAPSANGHSQKAAIPVRRSITPDYIVCLEDGKKLKMLKRHLRTSYGLSPEEYCLAMGTSLGLSDGCPELLQKTFSIRLKRSAWDDLRRHNKSGHRLLRRNRRPAPVLNMGTILSINSSRLETSIFNACIFLVTNTANRPGLLERHHSYELIKILLVCVLQGPAVKRLRYRQGN